MQERLGPILRQSDHRALPAGKRIAFDFRKVVYRMYGAVAEIVIYLQAQLRGDLVRHVSVQSIADTRNIGLQMIIKRLPAHARHRNVG